nr:MAG TPA: Replication associated protein [Microviridae sp.]
MPCYHPLYAQRSRTLDPVTGKRVVLFPRKAGAYPGYDALMLPCGRCLGCRHDYAKHWAIRCVHESQLYKDNCFITLTFDSLFLPVNGSLDKSCFQLFIKRLRKRFFGSSKSDVRYFMCGEYGAEFGRPHYHACLFNFDFPDKVLWKSAQDTRLYRSAILESLWSFGFSSIGDVTFESAAYVARYVLKKINGKLASDHYQGRLPEYTAMSRRPGIACDWYEKFKDTDVFPRDFVVLNGSKSKVPRYYNRRYELTNPDEYAILRDIRVERAKVNPNNCPDRLRDAEIIRRSRDSRVKRSYEEI